MAMALRSLITRSSLSPLFFSRAFATKSFSSSPLLRLRPLVSMAESRCLTAERVRRCSGLKCFSTRATTSSLNDPSPNWSNRPPKETILLDGCDFEHWLVVMEPPEGNPTRDEIIDSYIKTLAQVVGSDEEARMKIYSVSTRHYFAFGALVSEELSYKIKTLPRVRWVLPDSYLDVKNKDYGGEPFINGQAVPYDPKYHEEWVRNNARANERSRRNDRPRNFDRSRNFERRRENMQNRDFQNRDVPPMPNQDMQSPVPPRESPPPMPNMPPRDMPMPNMPPRDMPMPNMPPREMPMPNMPPREMPPIPNRDGQSVMPPSAQYSNNSPGALPNPSFQGRDGPNMSGGPHMGGMPQNQRPAYQGNFSGGNMQGAAPNRPYQNQGPSYQSNYVPNRDGGNVPGGNAYGSGGSYTGGGNAYQGGGSAYPPGGNAYGGGGGAYQAGGGNAYQGGGGSPQGGVGNSYQGGGAAPQGGVGNTFQGGGGNAYQGGGGPLQGGVGNSYQGGGGAPQGGVGNTFQGGGGSPQGGVGNTFQGGGGATEGGGGGYPGGGNAYQGGGGNAYQARDLPGRD